MAAEAESDTQRDFFLGLSKEAADTYAVKKMLLDEELKKKRFNLWTVTGHPSAKGKEIETVVIHEFGHVMHDQIFGGANGETLRATREVLTKQEAQAMQRKWVGTFRKHKKSDSFSFIRRRKRKN